MNFKVSKYKLAEDGMASILVTMISMIIIALIITGFTQLSLRGQQNALDRQLNTQAQYAAQTGINDAANVVNAALSTGTAVPAKTTCGDPGSGPYHALYTSGKNNLGFNESYTCLLVNPTPYSLLYNPIAAGQPKIIQVEGASGAVGSATISWQNHGGVGSTLSGGGCGSGNGYTQFPANSGWTCQAGVLRVDIVPMDDITQDDVLFLHPNPNPGLTTATYSTANPGDIIPVDCANPGANPPLDMPNDCNFNITVPGDVYLRITPFYDPQDVTITAFPSSGRTCTSATCNSLALSNDQVLIDSTGKAQDVLSRIQVRQPSNPLDGSLAPANALQSTTSICKEFEVLKNGPSVGSLSTQDESNCASFFSP